MEEVKYGFISDAHEDPGIVMSAISVLKGFGAQRLVLNGDIGGFRGNPEITMGALAFILEQAGQSGLETFVQPGSHESIRFYQPVVDALCGNGSKYGGKYINLFDVTKQLKFEKEGHHLVFAPGSCTVTGMGEYHIGSGFPSGRYVKLQGLDEKGQKIMIAQPLKRVMPYLRAIEAGFEDEGAFQYFNMKDLHRLVTEPKKTILICHEPRRFNFPNGVDVADFGIALEEHKVDEDVHKKGSIYRIDRAKELLSAGAPIELKRENRGSEDFALVYPKIGILKAVNGHFHESSQRAHDVKGNDVPQEKFVNELFWNSGWMDKKHCGILTVRGEEVAYQNIDLGNL